MNIALRLWFDCIGIEIMCGGKYFVFDFWPFTWELCFWRLLERPCFVAACGPLHVSLVPV